jgi:membrane glycosyltransferase
MSLESVPSAPAASASTTPTGLQSEAELTFRRRLVIALNVGTWALLMLGAGLVAGSGGWTLVDLLMFLAFAVGTPWSVLGFWNAVIGLWLLHLHPDPREAVAPYAEAGDGDEPIRVKTAVFMTLRNEDPERAVSRMRLMKASVDATGYGAQFDWFLLSDTNDPAVGEREQELARAWEREDETPSKIVYRRRTDNTGFKAGNVRDFCERWGGDYELMLPLDADSLMTGEVIVRHVRMMQAHPKLGILQSLVVGMPSRSAFARIFQFGMRAGMRAYTMGQSWWTADCGPFWGHNALVRVAPFRDHCHLPVLPGGPPLGGHVMSHDQVEATLMRRAGYEVRVLPEEGGSYEENPPTILEFSKRDLRWCLGNLQYTRLLGLDILPMSRFQLLWAILMFVSVPGWTLLIALLPVKLLEREDLSQFPAGLAVTVYCAYFLMYLAPKLAGFVDVLLTPGAPERYGGRLAFVRSAAVELVFSFLLGAVTTFRITVFMIGLALGKSRIAWSGQARDAHGVSWRTAVEGLWPVTAFGLAVMIPLAVMSPTVLAWSLPLTLGYLTAIPFAVLLSDERIGMRSVRAGLAAIPEDFDPPAELRRMQDATAAKRAAARLTGTVAVARSVLTYHGDAAKRAAMDALYARFVAAGDLVFDVGAHVGDRVASFRRLGARVVALEPQPGPAAVVETLFWDDPDVTLLRAAAARAPGEVELKVNSANPTVSTASPDFVRAADGALGWEGQAWDETLVVRATTLDRLIAQYGRPAFIKIDVEGFEAEVLSGLGHAVPALSFEFTTIERGVALKALDLVARLGPYRFDLALGESQRLHFGRFVSKDEMAAHIEGLPASANSGDVYAVLQPGEAG